MSALVDGVALCTMKQAGSVTKWRYVPSKACTTDVTFVWLVLLGDALLIAFGHVGVSICTALVVLAR